MFAWLPTDRRDRLIALSGVYLVVAVPLAMNQAAHDTAIWEKLAVVHLIVLRFCLGWCFGERRFSRYVLDLPALALLAWVALSWTQAINPMKSGLEVIRVLLAVTLYAAVARTYRPDYLKLWMAAMSAVLIVVSIIGIAQYLGFQGAAEIRSAGLPSATFWYRNFAAMYVISVVPVAVALLLFTDSDRQAMLWALASGLGVVFLIYTRTRGAWVGLLGGFFLAGALWFLTRSHRQVVLPRITSKRGALLTAVAAVIVVGASLPPIGEQVSTQMASSGKTGVAAAAVSIVEGRHSGRLGTWLQTLDLIRDHWLIGVGTGNWDLVFPRYAQERALAGGAMFFRPHNDYLWILSELGIVGGLLVVWVGYVLLSTGIRCLTGAAEAEEGALVLAMLIGTAAVAGHAFFSFPKERATTVAILPFYAGILAAIRHRQSGASGAEENGLTRLVAIGLTVLCLLSLPTVIGATQSFRHYFLADIYYRLGHFGPSLANIEAAKAAGIMDARYFEIEGEARKQLGDLEGALASRREGLPYHPDNPWSHHAIGVYAQELGRDSEALPALRRAVELAPKVGPILRDLALSTYRTGDVDRAHEMYGQAISLSPGDVLTRLEASDFFVATGDTATARTHLAEAAHRISENSIRLRTLGRHALRAAAWEIAERAFVSAFDINPTLEAALGVAHARMGAGNASEAISFLEEVRARAGDADTRSSIDHLLARIRVGVE